MHALLSTRTALVCFASIVLYYFLLFQAWAHLPGLLPTLLAAFPLPVTNDARLDLLELIAARPNVQQGDVAMVVAALLEYMQQRSHRVPFALQMLLTVAGKLARRFIRNYNEPIGYRVWNLEDANDFMSVIENQLVTDLHEPALLAPLSRTLPAATQHPADHLYTHHLSGVVATVAQRVRAACQSFNAYLALECSSLTSRVLVSATCTRTFHGSQSTRMHSG